MKKTKREYAIQDCLYYKLQINDGRTSRQTKREARSNLERLEKKYKITGYETSALLKLRRKQGKKRSNL